MTTLRFSLDPSLAQQVGGEVPVEVTRADMVRLESTTSSKSLEVPPGEYYVTLRAPGVEGISQRIEINEGESLATVKLTAKSSAPAPATLPIEERGVLGSIRRFAVAAPVSYVRRNFFRVTLRMFQGNIFQGLEASVPQFETEEKEDVVKVNIPPNERQSIAQLLVFGLPPINIVLPIAAQVGCTLFVHTGASTPWVACSIENEQGRLLLQFRRSGRLWEAEAMIRSDLLSEQLLMDKNRDPIAAAVGAYTLLRLNNLDALHDWTKNLMNWFPQLPDGAVARGEHLARLGQHRDAAEAFLAIRDRGLPVFLDGVSFVTSRLDLYTGSPSMVGDSYASQLRDFQMKLGAITAFLNPHRTVSTFTGLDPMQPDNNAVRQTKLPGARPIT